MENKKMKFVIVSPRQTGGGAIVLHKLCKLLADRGYDAKIFHIGPSSMKGINRFIYWLQYFWYLFAHDLKKCAIVRIFHGAKFTQSNRFSGYNYEPVRGCKTKWLPIVDDDTIVIYPEIVYGNPLGAKNVIRWLCYYYPYEVNDNKAYDEKDVFIAYRDQFNDSRLNPSGIVVTLKNFDDELYRNYGSEKRAGSCYIIRKGCERKDLPEKFDGPIIDDLTEKEIVDIFNKCKYCISYDTQTFYSTIAAYCGCISIVVTENGKTREDYLGAGEKAYGVAYGYSEEEIQHAMQTKEELFAVIKKIKDNNTGAIDAFLDKCKNVWGRE